MLITEEELRTMFHHWCNLNDLKPSNGKALNAFCKFAQSYFEIKEVNV